MAGRNAHWITRGDGASTWYFVGATFAFAWSSFQFTQGRPVIAWILFAVGAVAIGVGIAVFSRGLRDDGRGASDVPPPSDPGSSSPPPPRI